MLCEERVSTFKIMASFATKMTGRTKVTKYWSPVSTCNLPAGYKMGYCRVFSM